MTIHEFVLEGKNAVVVGLRRKGIDDIVVKEAEVLKANDTVCYGLNLREKGSIIGRTVYLDDLFSRYTEGETLIELFEELGERCMFSLTVQPPPTAAGLESAFDNYRERLSVRLLSIDQNRAFIEDKPFIDAGNGLVLVAVINSERNIMSEWKITVTNSLMKDLESDRETLLTDALRNTMEMEPAVFMRLEDVVLSRIENGAEPDNFFKDNSDICIPDAVHILTNESMFLGAAALFYPETMKKIAELLKCGYTVIPSSIHEVMIVPDAMGFDTESMRQFLCDGNDEVVNEDDILSYDIYHYDPDTCVLDVVA